MSSKKVSSLKDVTEMAIVEIADSRTKKFLRDQPLEKMTSGKILPLKSKKEKREETILQGSSKERSQTWQKGEGKVVRAK